jgi:purine-binding chemotaxis protein CheW
MATKKCVIFRIGRERYAIDVAFVNNISDYKEITKVPDARPEVVGVVNLRGEVIPIVNMAKRLGSQNAVKKEDGKLIIAQYDNVNAGFLVDETSRVYEVDDSDIEPPPALLKSHDFELIRGILHIEGNIVILLELTRIFELLRSHEEI